MVLLDVRVDLSLYVIPKRASREAQRLVPPFKVHPDTPTRIGWTIGDIPGIKCQEGHPIKCKSGLWPRSPIHSFPVCNVQRVKSKVGRKLPPPTNATRTDFKSKG